ncbi:MAG: hypothetical protein HUU35_05720, partial [Armatimonadetes bacterium]|nr:hypothetical protein [Armatimonadota bacterium]
MSGNKYRATDLVWVLAALVVTLLMAACSGQGENGPVDRIDQVNVANAAAAALGDELERSEAEGVSAKDETAALAPAAAERKASPTRSEEVVDIHGKPVDAGPSRAYGAERLIDDPQMTRVGPAQYWITDRGVGIGGSMTWTYVNGGTVCNYAVWFSGLSGGRYQVLAYIPRRSATSRQALYRVESFVGSQWSVIRDVRVDQYSISDRWVDLGTFDFPAQPAVFLSDATGESYGTRRQVGFDAVKFIDRGSPPPPPAPAPRPAPAP